MNLERIAPYMVGLALVGCSSLSEMERAEQALAAREADLNATQHEIGQLRTSLLMLPKDSPPIIDLSRRKDLLGRQVGGLEKQVDEAKTKLAALKPITTVEQPPTKPGQPAVDPKTGLPAGPIPEPTKPEPTKPEPTKPEPTKPEPTKP